MRESYWVNADGLRVGFGTANTRNELAGTIEVKGRVRQVELKVYFDKDVTAADVRSAVLPAGATVLSADMIVDTAFVGGTSVTVGTIGTDDTGADVDGLVTATEAATANLTAGARIVGAGALVGTVLAADSNLTFATNGSYTAGEATVLVEYIVPAA